MKGCSLAVLEASEMRELGMGALPGVTQSSPAAGGKGTLSAFAELGAAVRPRVDNATTGP